MTLSRVSAWLLCAGLVFGSLQIHQAKAESAYQAWIHYIPETITSAKPYSSYVAACLDGVPSLVRNHTVYKNSCSRIINGGCGYGELATDGTGVCEMRGFATGGQLASCPNEALTLHGGGPFTHMDEMRTCASHQFYVIADRAEPLTQFSPATQPVDACGGNPINIASGDKMQDEIDLSGDHRSGLELVRYYRSQSIAAYNPGTHWQHNFDKQLRFDYSTPMAPHDGSNPLHSNIYTTEQAACQSGWNDVKSQSSLATLGNTDARYENGLCKVYVNSIYHSTLTIARNVGIFAGEPMLRFIHIDHPNGHSYRFHKKADAEWVTDADTTFLLTQDGSGYKLTEANGAIETYDPINGKLTKIEKRGEPALALGYNAQNLLSRVANVSSGRALTFAYNTNNTLASVTDFDGGILAYEYDAQGNISRVTYPDATSKRYLYEDARFPHALTGIVDGKGQRYATWTYDAQGRATSSSHANGTDFHSMTYHADGSTIATNALGKQTTFHFDVINGARRLTRTEGHPTALCPGASTQTTYEANGRVASKTDWNGNVTAFEYNALGRLIKKTSAAGTPLARSERYEWNETGTQLLCKADALRATVFDYRNNVINRIFDLDISNPVAFPDEAAKACGNAKFTDPTITQRREFQLDYASNDVAISRIDGPRSDVNDVTTFDIDGILRVTRVHNVLFDVVRVTEFNAQDLPARTLDSNGTESVLTYDPRGRLLTRSLTLPGGNLMTRYDYDANGQLTRITLPSGEDLRYQYDAAHRLTVVFNHRGERIEFQLDAAGNILQQDVRSASGLLARTHQQAFNELSQLIQSIGAKNQLTEFDYDANGNPVSTTNPLLRTTLQDFDALNRVTKITDARNGVTRFTYNPHGLITTATDPRGVVTRYDYDGFGQLRKETSADRGLTTYTYDAAGNLATKTDARGFTTTYSYDAINRLTSVLYDDGTSATYTYDAGLYASGRLTKITDASGTLEFSYDVAGRLLSKVQKIGTKTFTTRYSYDALGRVATMTYPSGVVVGYGYDAGRVTSITVNGLPLLSNIAYEPFGEMKGWILGNGAAFTRSFDLDGQLINQTMATGTRTSTFDAASRIKSFSDPMQSMTFTYDELDRLTKSTGIGRTFSYDANGNRTSDKKGAVLTSYNTEPSSNRLLSTTSGLTTKVRSYDAAGNIINDGTYQFVYDARGRMAQSKNAAGTVIGSYTLNDLGQRVKKVRGTATTYFVYDEAGHLIGEYNSAGTAVQETIYLGDMPVGIWKANTRHYIHADHLNTARAIVNQSNTVIWLWKADPFGTINPTADPDGDGKAFVYNLRFPGQYFDQETGLFYNYFRDYDPRTGRYVQSDPIGLGGGLNTFAYVEGNPIIGIDPLGLFDVKARGLPRRGNGYRYEVRFYGVTGIPTRRASGLIRPLSIALRLAGLVDRGTGVSDASDIPEEWRCDVNDAAAKKIYDDLGLDSGKTMTESQLREFLRRVTEQIPELQHLYNPDVVVPLANSRAVPSEGWGDNLMNK